MKSIFILLFLQFVSCQFVIYSIFDDNLSCNGTATRIQVNSVITPCVASNCSVTGTLSQITSCGLFPNVSSIYYSTQQGFNSSQCTGYPSLAQFFLTGYCFVASGSSSYMYTCSPPQKTNYGDSTCTSEVSFNPPYSCTNTVPFGFSNCSSSSVVVIETSNQETIQSVKTTQQHTTTQNLITQGIQINSSDTVQRMVYTLAGIISDANHESIFIILVWLLVVISAM